MSSATPKADESSHLLGHLQHLLEYHESMLSDGVRNRAIHKALKKQITPGSSVLDIGTGTGIWAIAAAKLGASRVVAVEREKLLIPIIEKLVRNNGVADRVEVLIGDSRDLKIKGKFDLVISETIGNDAFDEQIVSIMMDARKRFLKAGGTMIPERVTSMIAPAHLNRYCTSLPAGLALEYRYLELLNVDIPRRVQDRTAIKLLAPAKPLLGVELSDVKAPPDLTDLSASWRLREAGELNCLVIWAEVLLAEGIKLQTFKSSNWSAIVFPLDPSAAGPAKIDCQLTLTDKQYFWTVNVTGKNRNETQSHSPVFPFTSIEAKIQSGQNGAH